MENIRKGIDGYILAPQADRLPGPEERLDVLVAPI